MHAKHPEARAGQAGHFEPGPLEGPRNAGDHARAAADEEHFGDAETESGSKPTGSPRDKFVSSLFKIQVLCSFDCLNYRLCLNRAASWLIKETNNIFLSFFLNKKKKINQFVPYELI